LPASNPEKETSKLSLTGGSLKLGAIDPSTLRPARSAQGRPTVDVKVNRRRNTEEAWQAFKERSLTSAEKDKMKHYEKKLPKQDFIDRYGKEQGEAIYYATATKMAKKNA
jgi:wobble nucleotide-excising tRNase